MGVKYDCITFVCRKKWFLSTFFRKSDIYLCTYCVKYLLDNIKNSSIKNGKINVKQKSYEVINYKSFIK